MIHIFLCGQTELLQLTDIETLKQIHSGTDSVQYSKKGGITMLDFIKQYWLESAFTLIVSALSLVVKRLYSKFKQEIATQRLLKEGMLAILHDRLYQLCTSYIDRGCITVDELENLEYLYKSYHNLGGNGTGTSLFERCKALKITHSSEKE